jgi:hypothetical protein
MRRGFPIAVVILLLCLVGMAVWLANGLPKVAKAPAKNRVMSQVPTSSVSAQPLATEGLLLGYGDPATPPIEDLRKIHRLVTGYFSVIKDESRFPIGGNEDLAAALLGANANRESFIRSNNPVLSPSGLLLDRWQSPLIVHPEASRQLELRSAGPDRIPYNQDDLILTASGLQKSVE